MLRLIILILVLMAGPCGIIDANAQGKVSRPSQQQSQANKSKKSSPKVNASEPDGYINGYGYVDLGLPSGTKWAICNIGATSPSEYGESHSMAEAFPSTVNFSEYGSLNLEEIKRIGLITTNGLVREYDIANIILGDAWQLPNEDDIKELMNTCSWKKSSYSGVIGWFVVGPNKRSIFLPNTDMNNILRQDYMCSTISETGNTCGLSLDRYVVPEPGLFFSSVRTKTLIRAIIR